MNRTLYTPEAYTPGAPYTPDALGAPGARRLALLLVLAPAALGCASRFGRITAESAPGHLASAEQELAAEPPLRAFERLQAVWTAESLTPEDRNRTQALLESAAGRIAASPAVDGDDLVDLADQELPKRLRIEMWIAGAQRLLEEGERMEAFRAIRDLEEQYPLHLERAAAAEVVAQAGFSLAADDGTYLLFFDYRDRAPGVLEYLVLTFPSSPHCDRAYWTLGEKYEEDEEWREALERHEDLLLYHPGSPYTIYSEAKIPYLRLARVTRAAYDRSAFRRARAELERWLERHAGHELEPDVVELLEECSERLVDNDIVVARFYVTISNAFGARYHAERGLVEARLLGDAERVAACEALLASLPADDADIDPSRVLGPRLDEAVDEGFGIPVEGSGLDGPGVDG